MKTLPTAVVLCLLASVSGCLDFDAQQIVLRHDVAADRIEMMLVYRGLFAKGTRPESTVASAIEDLDEARARGHMAFFSPFPLAVDPVDGMRRHGDLLRHLDIENGGLFTDPKGRLCGYQFVRIREAKTFLGKLQAELYDRIEEADLPPFVMTEQGSYPLGDESLRALRAWRERGEPLLTLAGGRLQLRLPLEGEDHARIRKLLAHRLAKAAAREITTRIIVAQRRASGGSPTDTSAVGAECSVAGEHLATALQEAPSLRVLADNEFALLREDDATVIWLGDPAAAELRFEKAGGGLYHDLLLQRLTARGDAIEVGVPDQELARRFAAFGRREAVLPEALREARGGS